MTPTTPKTVRTGATSGLRILVAESDPDLRTCLRVLAGFSGVELIEVEDGGAALATVWALRPDIIVTAWGRAGLGEAAAVHTLRREGGGYQPYFLALPPVAAEAGWPAEALDAGVDDIIDPAAHPEVIAARLRNAQRLIELQRTNSSQAMRINCYSEELRQLNARPREQVFTDDLTGLPNRRHALEWLEQAWSLATRYDLPLSCLVIDLAGLKRINSLHGQERGDVVLKTVAAVIRNMVRAQDKVCRLGGSEYLMICPNTPLEAVMVCGGRLICYFETLQNDTDPLLGLSIGAAERRSTVANAQALVDLASRGCSEAKRHGRNRTCTVQTDSRPSLPGGPETTGPDGPV